MERIAAVLEREGFELKAIPTEYRGITYRSRLEARWAVFLDELGVEHFYEYEGFQLRAGWYVPDFWLPKIKGGTWLEIKPEVVSDEEWKRCEQLAEGSGHRVALAKGPPVEILASTIECFHPYAWDDNYCFAECRRCGAIGIEFEGRGERVCGLRCFPDSDKGRDWTDRLEQARLEAMRASFWDPR